MEAEQQELDDHEQVAYYLQRLEELEDQVGTFNAASLDWSTERLNNDSKLKIQHTKDDISLKMSLQELRASVMGAHTHTPPDTQ